MFSAVSQSYIYVSNRSQSVTKIQEMKLCLKEADQIGLLGYIWEPPNFCLADYNGLSDFEIKSVLSSDYKESIGVVCDYLDPWF